jgi:hypothetical protein
MSNDPSTLNGAASDLLNKLYGLFGKSNVMVTSAGRTPTENAAAGGVSNSDHLSGGAIDFKVNGLTPQQVQAAIYQSGGITYGQLIDETSKGITHISVGTGKENLEQTKYKSYMPVLDTKLKSTKVPDLASLGGGATAPASSALKNAWEVINAALGGSGVTATAGDVVANESGGAISTWATEHIEMLVVGGIGIAIILFGSWSALKSPIDTVTNVAGGAAKKLAGI